MLFRSLALGTETNYFGNESVAKNSLALKKVSDAIDVRSAILSRLEHAISLPVEERAAFTTFVIAGGGPTGVELAGALAELRRSVIPADYPELTQSPFRILLVDGGERLLGAMSEKSSRAAAEFMKENDIEVYQDVLVKEFDGKLAKLSNGEEVPTHTLVWAAGVRALIPPGINSEKIERGSGRVRVDESNRIEGYKNIFAIGDIALMSTVEKPRGDPMLAPVAKQQGYHLARNFPRLLEDRALLPFKYRDKGVLAVLGRNHAVAEIGKIAFDGFVAWLLWLFVHIMFLVGFRNRLIVLFEWAWNYFTYDRVIRIIVRPLSRTKL